MVNSKRTVTNRITFIIIYFLAIFILGSVFIYLFSAVYITDNKNIDYNTLIKFIAGTNVEVSDLASYNEASGKIQGYANMLSYLIVFASSLFLMKSEYDRSLDDLNKHKKLYFIIPILGILFTAIAYLVDYLVSLAVPSTENQTTIVSIMKTNGMIPMIITTVFLAPVVEELIYRGVIFGFTKKNVALGYIFSIILFVLPHMISTPISNIGTWLLMCVPYLVSAVLLCLIYHKTNFNIYASICAHMLNNILAVILIFI